MNKHIKKAMTILTIVILIIIVTILDFFIIKELEKKEKINNVIEIYSDNNIQEKLENLDSKENNIESNLALQIDGKIVVRCY